MLCTNCFILKSNFWFLLLFVSVSNNISTIKMLHQHMTTKKRKGYYLLQLILFFKIFLNISFNCYLPQHYVLIFRLIMCKTSKANTHAKNIFVLQLWEKKIYELHEEERQKGKGEVMRQWRNLSTLIFVISKLIFFTNYQFSFLQSGHIRKI